MQHDVASLPRDPSSPPPDLVFTYVCNGRTLADVFAGGNLAKWRGVAAQFGSADAARCKAIERTTNHDVKAVEYYLKELSLIHI